MVAQVGGPEGMTYDDVKAHPYFEGMDWEVLGVRGIPVPDLPSTWK